MELVSLGIAWMVMAPVIWWINRAVARAEDRRHPVKRVLPDNVVDLATRRVRPPRS